jgi:predicted MPP superfamily phosphohydrolase
MPKKIFSLIHISDLHYSAPKLQKKDILNKRLLGYWNEAIRKKYLNNARRKAFFEKLAIYLAQKRCDLLVITGDFSNLALNEEFQQAKQEIKFFFPNQEIIALAGNHDRYLRTITKEERFEKYFGEYCPFAWKTREKKSVHTIEVENQFQLVFFDMAVPNILSARGKLSDNFFQEYQKKIEHSSSLKKIGFGHYPLGLPADQKERYFRRLHQTKKLENQIIKDKFVAYFHGHIHKNWIRTFKKEGHNLCCVSTGGTITKTGCFCHKMDMFSDGSWNIEPIIQATE